MSYFDNYGQYDNYRGGSGSRRNSNSFTETNSGAGRKNDNRRYANRRRGGGNAGGSRSVNIDTPLFKEPMAPPRKSPTVPRRRSPVQGRRYDYQGQNRSAQLHFDMRDMPNFVEPEHSGPKWNWSNYADNCKSWLAKHQLSYYKSRCLALEFENQMLFKQINSLMEETCIFAAERGVQPSIRLPDIFINGDEENEADNETTKNNEEKEQKKRPQEGKERRASESEISSSDLECELPQTFLDFVETRIRHKINLKLQRREDAKKKKVEDDKIKGKKGPKQPVGAARQKELDRLYGEKSALIHKLETSMQLKFNRNCDTFKPELWMAVPLNPVTTARK